MQEIEEETRISVKTAEERAAAKSATTRAATTNLARRKVKSGMFDAPEYVAIAIGAAALFAVILSYFFLLVPAREDFKKREAERSQKQTQLLDLQQKANAAGDRADSATALMDSVDRFEKNFLPVAAQGNIALYSRLNELIRVNNLRNTAGPEYSPLELINFQQAGRSQTDASGRAKPNNQQSLFPGTRVSVTVEGSYANLRRFISDLENTRQFLVINAVQIQSNGSQSNSGANNTKEVSVNAPNNPTINQMKPMSGFPTAGESGSLPNAPKQSVTNQPPKRGAVSMRLELAAYFRRSISSNAPTAAN
jgi:Tfp pilus assembly protein PilO